MKKYFLSFNLEIENGGDGKTVDQDINDRAIFIGTAIPSTHAIDIFQNGTRAFIGTEDGIFIMPTIATSDIRCYYGINRLK